MNEIVEGVEIAREFLPGKPSVGKKIKKKESLLQAEISLMNVCLALQVVTRFAGKQYK